MAGPLLVGFLRLCLPSRGNGKGRGSPSAACSAADAYSCCRLLAAWAQRENKSGILFRAAAHEAANLVVFRYDPDRMRAIAQPQPADLTRLHRSQRRWQAAA